MRSLLTTSILCIAVQAASAQCVATVPASNVDPQAAAAQPANAMAAAVRNGGATPAVAQRGELIKTAAAGTTRPAMPHEARPRTDDDHPHRSGTAMLLAALALMSGIALRRYGSPRR